MKGVSHEWRQRAYQIRNPIQGALTHHILVLQFLANRVIPETQQCDVRVIGRVVLLEQH